MEPGTLIFSVFFSFATVPLLMSLSVTSPVWAVSPWNIHQFVVAMLVRLLSRMRAALETPAEIGVGRAEVAGHAAIARSRGGIRGLEIGLHGQVDRTVDGKRVTAGARIIAPASGALYVVISLAANGHCVTTS